MSTCESPALGWAQSQHGRQPGGWTVSSSALSTLSTEGIASNQKVSPGTDNWGLSDATAKRPTKIRFLLMLVCDQTPTSPGSH